MFVLQPYLHQSRHNHAARRVRGPGGRFLTSDEVKALQASGELSGGTSNSASLSAPDRPSDSQGQAESPAQQQHEQQRRRQNHLPQQQQQQQGSQRAPAGPSNLVRHAWT